MGRVCNGLSLLETETSSYLFIQSPFLMGICSEMKELAPIGVNSLSPFGRSLTIRGLLRSKQIVTRAVLFVQMAEKDGDVPS